jgi:hypothetical protein
MLLTGVGGVGGHDSSVTQFIVATGITDDTIHVALDTFTRYIKDKGIWAKCPVIYPFVGGTASTHKYNLVNPLDTDGAYRITPNGGITHDANGVTGNGTNGYLDTHFDPSVLSQNSQGMTLYIRTLGTGHQSSNVDSSFNGHWMALNFGGGSYLATNSANGGALPVSSPKNALWTSNRRDSANQQIFRNGVSDYPRVISSTVNKSSAMPIFARRYDTSTIDNFDASNISFYAYHEGLTDQQITDFHFAINRLQTDLSRNVY